MKRHLSLAMMIPLLLSGCAELAPRPVQVTRVSPWGAAAAKPAAEVRPHGATLSETAAVPEFAAGQQWTFRRVDLWRNEESERFRQTLVFKEGNRWMVRWTILDSDNATRRGSITGELFDTASHGFADKHVSGRYEPLRFPLAPGKSWAFDYVVNNAGRTTRIHQSAKVGGWETISVPAGKYYAIRVDHDGRYDAVESGFGWSGTLRESYWYAPAVGRVVMHEYRDTRGDGGLWDQWRDELVEAAPPAPVTGTVAARRESDGR